jgi:O-antigen/teichoic acid export membrane protein
MTQIFSLFIGFFSSMLLAKEMGAFTFGVYSFAVAVISFVAIFFEFGYFASVSRILAVNQDKNEEGRYIGASLVIVGLISLAFFLTVLFLSFFVDDIFNAKIGYIIRIASIVSWAFILPFFMDLILKGCNKIEYLSGFNLFWKILFVVSLFIIYKFKILTPLNVLLCFSITCIIVFLFFVKKLKPSFDNLTEYIAIIHKENKIYGIYNYFSRAIGTSSFQFDRLMIEFFVGAKDVGFYSLANSMANPINSFSSALSGSKFKSFAGNNKISFNVLVFNFVWILIGVFCANLFGYIIINYYLGPEYKDVFLLLVLMSMAIAFQAAYQPYNSWMASNGLGKELLLISYYFTALNLFGNFIFIYFYGTLGAVFSTMLSNLYFLIHSIIIYKKELHDK